MTSGSSPPLGFTAFDPVPHITSLTGGPKQKSLDEDIAQAVSAQELLLLA